MLTTDEDWAGQQKKELDGRCVAGATYHRWVTPTVFREGPFRVHFFSLEEPRMHVHVVTSDGEAKFWMEPEIELARNHGLSDEVVNRALKLVTERQQEIRDAWSTHFPEA